MHSITRLVPRIAHSHTPTSTPIISPIIPANQEIVSLSPFYLLLPCPHLYLLQLPFLIFYSNKHQSNNDRWWIVIAYLPVTLQVLVSLSQNYCWLNDIALLCLNHLWTVSSTPKLTLLHPCKIVLHLVSMHQLINCCHISPSNFVGSYKFPTKLLPFERSHSPLSKSPTVCFINTKTHFSTLLQTCSSTSDNDILFASCLYHNLHVTYQGLIIQPRAIAMDERNWRILELENLSNGVMKEDWSAGVLEKWLKGGLEIRSFGCISK